jgi:hypothetical protein
LLNKKAAPVLYYSTLVCPPGFGLLRIGQGACTGPPPLSRRIKRLRAPSLDLLPLQFFPNSPLRPLGPLHHAPSTPLTWTYLRAPSSASPQLRILAARLGWKPRTSISHSGLDSPDTLMAILSLSRVALAEIRAPELESCTYSSSSSHHYHSRDGDGFPVSCSRRLCLAVPNALQPGQSRKCLTMTRPASA